MNLNFKLIIAFVLGLLVSATSVYAATILFQSDQVGYDNTDSGLASNNVQDAVDELHSKVVGWIDPNGMGTPTNYLFSGTTKPTTASPNTPPSGETLYLGLFSDNQLGVCITL